MPLLPGSLLLTGNATIELWEHGRRTPIACVRNTPTYFSHPVFAPNGKSIAYVMSTAPTSLAQDWGDDIYIANPDASGARLAFRHEAPGAQIDSLAWAPDGRALIYGSFRVLYDGAGRSATASYSINRLASASGAVSPLIANASQAAVSPDGKRLVYVSYPSSDFNISALSVANLDGSDAHLILNGQNGFQSFFAPHLSPDGARVVFAAVGGPLPGAKAPQPYNPQRSLILSPSREAPQNIKSALARVLAPSALADGSPYELWIANLDGTGMHTVAN
ncbi:MAG TPA: hypothetical protein VK821_00770, partial [Dehalococcoidia bacterium]|nr:hypothetical protein [Dehalococcoidia bacterium]